MERPDTVLLPRVISPEVLRIGQFQCNPLEPERSNYTPSEETLQSIRLAKPNPTRPFHGRIDLDSRGWFRVMLMHTFGVSIFGSSTTTLDVVADEVTYTGMLNAEAALTTVCTDEGARNWIREHKDDPIYFVIGLTTLRNAKFQQKVSDLVGGEGKVKISKSAAGGSAPLAGEVSGGGGCGSSGMTEGGSETGIFGVKLMKAKWKWLQKEDLPGWEKKPHWKFVYDQIKGAEREEKEFGLELQPLDSVEELVELREAFEVREAQENEKRAALEVDPDNE